MVLFLLRGLLLLDAMCYTTAYILYQSMARECSTADGIYRYFLSFLEGFALVGGPLHAFDGTLVEAWGFAMGQELYLYDTACVEVYGYGRLPLIAYDIGSERSGVDHLRAIGQRRDVCTGAERSHWFGLRQHSGIARSRKPHRGYGHEEEA